MTFEEIRKGISFKLCHRCYGVGMIITMIDSNSLIAIPCSECKSWGCKK